MIALFFALATTLHVPVERYTLPNGLTVLLHEDHRVPNVVVDILFRVGSKDEKAGRSGFAHLFEHLMFMGTKNVPNGSFDTIMEAVGGHNNASTTEDCTNYFEVGPSKLLARAAACSGASGMVFTVSGPTSPSTYSVSG